MNGAALKHHFIKAVRYICNRDEPQFDKPAFVFPHRVSQICSPPDEEEDFDLCDTDGWKTMISEVMIQILAMFIAYDSKNDVDLGNYDLVIDEIKPPSSLNLCSRHHPVVSQSPYAQNLSPT